MTDLKVKDFKGKQVSGMAKAYTEKLNYELIDLPATQEVELDFLRSKLESLDNTTKAQMRAEIEHLKRKITELQDDLNFRAANEFWATFEDYS